MNGGMDEKKPRSKTAGNGGYLYISYKRGGEAGLFLAAAVDALHFLVVANHVFHLLDYGGVGFVVYLFGGDVEVFFYGGCGARVEGEGVGGFFVGIDRGLFEHLRIAFGEIVHLTFPP